MKLGAISLAILLLTSLSTKAQLSFDTSVNKSKYDKRVDHYRDNWNNLIPTQAIVQYAGNMGMFSVGVGWDYGRHRQWETQFFIGFVPVHSWGKVNMTVTIKENYIPWSIYIKDGWTIEPFEVSLYLNSILAEDFWVHQPRKYPNGYYWFTTKARPNLAFGQRLCKEVPNNKRKYIKSITAFYEVSTCDIYLIEFIKNRYIKLDDVFSLSLGVKLQVF